MRKTIAVNRYDQALQDLFDVATGRPLVPAGGHVDVLELWTCSHAVHCVTELWVRYVSRGLCSTCRRRDLRAEYRRLPYHDVLLAAFLVGGGAALSEAAAALFNDTSASGH